MISDRFNNVRILLRTGELGQVGRIVATDNHKPNPYHIICEGYTAGMWYKRHEFEYVEPQISGAAAIDMIAQALDGDDPLSRIREIVEQYRHWNKA